MVNRDNKGRVKGYKRLFDIGMEIEQSGESMGSTSSMRAPRWLSAVGGTGWIKDGSGPMEFSLTPARKNTASLFKTFAEGVPAHKRWKWHNEIPYSDSRGGSGCGSHIHFGTKQSVNADMSGESLSQITIFYNTAVTILPFCTKWFSWGREGKLRDSWNSWSGIAGLDRYTQSTISSKLRMSQGSREGSYGNRYLGRGFMIWNRRSKSKCTLELRVNEAMPQWSLPFVDVFTMIAQKHIEEGDSPKMKNHRTVMQRLHNDINNNGKVVGMLDYTIEFEEGRELLAPVPHIIGEKFPRVMTVGEFLKLIDRIAYWIFAYSSRKLYTKQLRFRALGGDPTRLPLEIAWEPWKYTIKDMFEYNATPMPTAGWIRENFPKVVKRTHTPFAHVRLGESRLPDETEEETADVTEETREMEETDSEASSLRNLIDLFGVNEAGERGITFGDTDSISNLATSPSLEIPNMWEDSSESDGVSTMVDVDVYMSTVANRLHGCERHEGLLDHSCNSCLSIHNYITAYGIVCVHCVENNPTSVHLGERIYSCHHNGGRNVVITFRRDTQLIGDCRQCTHNYHRVRHHTADGNERCSHCIVKVYRNHMDSTLPILRRLAGMR